MQINNQYVRVGYLALNDKHMHSCFSRNALNAGTFQFAVWVRSTSQKWKIQANPGLAHLGHMVPQKKKGCYTMIFPCLAILLFFERIPFASSSNMAMENLHLQMSFPLKFPLKIGFDSRRVPKFPDKNCLGTAESQSPGGNAADSGPEKAEMDVVPSEKLPGKKGIWERLDGSKRILNILKHHLWRYFWDEIQTKCFGHRDPPRWTHNLWWRPGELENSWSLSSGSW